ncbi:MAG: CHAT domain-containing protein [Telluria sp.]
MFTRSLAVLGSLLFASILLTGCPATVAYHAPPPPPVAMPAPEVLPHAPPAPPPPALPVEQKPAQPSSGSVPISYQLPTVYNASLSPQLPRDAAKPERPVLHAGQPTTLVFAIGPMRLTSTMPPVMPSLALLRSQDDVPLSVVLVCSFCEGDGDTLQRMTYRPKDRQSGEIRYQFTPRQAPDGAAYTDALQVTIINDHTGREYDRLMMPVEINKAGARAGADPDGEVELRAASSFVEPAWKADVVLYAMRTSDRNVSISVRPVSAAMTKLLGPLALDRYGYAKTFRSGIDDPELVAAMTSSAYGAVSAVGTQNELLKKISATGANAYVSVDSQNSLKLTPFEAGNVTGILAANGQRLYRHLFYDSADEDLGALIAQLEAAAAAAPDDRPLRLVVVTDRLSLPWQYLHPVGKNVDARKFWGVQFSISVLRANNRASDKPVWAGTTPPAKILFARYGRDDDPSAIPAGEQITSLLALPLADADLVRVDSGKNLLKQLSDERNSIDAIITFLHASVGDTRTPPHLKFNEGDIVTSDSLENLLNIVEPGEQKLRYLARAPLVILNACETGPARNLPHVKLENAMFQLGARGVVVTEVSVWVSLGHAVATSMISRLGKGEPVSDALTMVRRELLDKKQNPLGLLYAYYGDPAATLQRPPAP